MRVALIGYGYWGKIIEKYIGLSGFDLEYIYCLENIDHNKVINNLDIVWQDKEIEAVFVCTPIKTHYNICKKAFECGKHVFCEKPTTKNNEELEQLLELAKNQEKILYTDYIYITSPSIQYIKQYVNKIGNLQAVTGRIEQFGNFYPDDNVYEVLGVHLISSVSYITGKSARIAEFNDCFGERQALAGEIRYVLEDGCSVNLFCSLVSNEKVRRLTFIGDKGIIDFSMNTEPNVLIRLMDERDGVIIETEKIEKIFDETQGLYHSLSDFRNVLDTLDNRDNEKISCEVSKLLL